MMRFVLMLIAVKNLLVSMAHPSPIDAVVLSSYHVSTKVNSRLLTTSIDMTFENSEDCSSIYTLTLQLPRNGRVTDLTMNLSNGCQQQSQVKNLNDAVSDFKELSSEGKAAAILTAWDMSNYQLEVSIPPSGITNVTLKYQELLFQKLNKVSFQVPMFPGIDVDDLQVDVSVEDDVGGVLGFETELQDTDKFLFEKPIISMNENKAAMHYEKTGVTQQNSIPTLIHAHFQPGLPPENSIFSSDGRCFTHIFNPTNFLSHKNIDSMARKIVFVIDVSGSMSGKKLTDAKASFAMMIQNLNERDVFVIQAFSNLGTERKWGPKPADSQNKANAMRFVDDLETISSTNLNDAFLDGIDNVSDVPETVVPIIVMLTDGRGNSGARDIAKNVRDKNEASRVKIFSLAFGNDADINLLLAIAIQNGGHAVRIYEGFGDASDQMELYYQQELGSILASDLSVTYKFGDDDNGVRDVISDYTVSSFPILATGSEIVVRGNLMDSWSDAGSTSSGHILKSSVSATSSIGLMEWSTDHLILPDNRVSFDCRQSLAQARIMEILEYRDAEQSIGDDLLMGSTIMNPLMKNLSDTSSFEEEAQKIALEASLVWPGLTALVTIESSNCQQNKSNVCYVGAGYSDFWRSEEGTDKARAYAPSPAGNKVASAPSSPRDADDGIASFANDNAAASSGNDNTADDGIASSGGANGSSVFMSAGVVFLLSICLYHWVLQ